MMEGGNPVVIANSEGVRTTPSVVAFTKNGERLVGEAAKRQATVNPARTISSVKRKMGSDYRVRIDGKEYSPEQISAMILQKLKKDAQDYIGSEVTKAVITVPAYFTDAQRQATRDAGRIAGLKVLRIINEPTSAAFAYGLDNGTGQKVLVYDLGGGTFDVSVIEIGENLIEVLATAGDNHLGGDDFDERITDYLIKEFKKENKIDLSRDPAAFQRVRDEAEKAKKELSNVQSVTISIPFITMAKDGPRHLESTLTRAKFDELTADLVERTAGPVRQALSDAGITSSELGRVLLVGGSTRIPAVCNCVRRLTGKEPAKSLNPDECVALGAAIQAEKLSGAGLVSSAGSQIILMDVTPLSLSIETVGGVATKVIDRNTTIPCRKSQIFTTAGNFQTSVDIKVLQGERHFARDNTLLGNFRLDKIKRALAGVPQIEVTFDIDVNGIVSVSAKDLATGNEQHITVTTRGGMSEEEIQRAIYDAQMNETQDRRAQEYADIYNQAQAFMFSAEQALKDEKKKLDRETKKQIKEDIAALKHALGKCKPQQMTAQQADMIREAKEKLERDSAQIFQN